MKSLARLVMAGPGQAVLVTVISAVLALFFPPFAWISGAAVALVTLHLGSTRGLQIIAMATLVSGGFFWLAMGSPLAGLMLALALWLPLWLVGQVLRQTVSLSLAWQLAAGMGLIMMLVLHYMAPGLVTEINHNLAQLFQQMMKQQSEAHLQDAMQKTLHSMQQVMPGLMGAGFMMSVQISLMLARSWQAALYNPGGFGQEFSQLRLGQGMAALVTVLLLFVVLTDNLLGSMALLVFLSLYLLQGLAVVHGLMGLLKLNRGWLVGLYALLFIVPQTMFLVAIFGLTDAWIDIRRKLNRQT